MPFYPKKGSDNDKKSPVKGDSSAKREFADNNTDKEDAHLKAKSLFDEHTHPKDVKKALASEHGHGQAADTLREFDKKNVEFKKKWSSSNNKTVAWKETLDKIAFGAGNLQFINLLFFLLFPSYVVIGIFLSIRSLISSSIENNYDGIIRNFKNEKSRAYWYGSMLGYSFILLALSITFRSRVLFIVAFLLVGILGSLYVKSSSKIASYALSRDRLSHYVKWVAYYGLIIVSAIMIVAGIILDIFNKPYSIPIRGGAELQIYGYALLFFTVGIITMISSYSVSQLKPLRDFKQEQTKPILKSVGSNFSELKRRLAGKGFLRTLLVSGILFYSAQTSLNYLFGLYLYETFNSFTFVALLLASTIITGFLVPVFFDQKTIIRNGRSSLLFLGAGLATILPLILSAVTIPEFRVIMIHLTRNVAFTSQIYAIDLLPLFYLLIAITGASLAGMAYSRITIDLLRQEERRGFSKALGVGTGFSTAAMVILMFLLRGFTGSFGWSFLVSFLVYGFVTVMFSTLVSKNSEDEYQKSLSANKAASNALVSSKKSNGKMAKNINT